MLENKIVVITGANSGIGKETAIALAEQGAHIVMICRSEQRGEAARQKIIEQSGNAQVDLILCDLSVQADIKRCGKAMREKYTHIDVLINNAGGFFTKRRESADGLEMTFALDHMGYFLLTHYLLDLVKKGTIKRIINVSSEAHRMPRNIPWDDLQHEESYKSMQVYGEAKLYNIYFTKKLAELVRPDGITVNTLHPGFVASNFGSGQGWGMQIVWWLLRPFQISEKQGAKTSIYLASSPEVEEVTGQYFEKQKQTETTALANNQANIDRLWELSKELSEVETFGQVH